jgi:multisubunit Na+/H+ antiporter MnhF subunit
MKAQGLAEPPSFGSIAAEALAAMLRAIGRVLSGPTTGDRVEGLGSLSTYLGFLLIVVWAFQQLNPTGA